LLTQYFDVEEYWGDYFPEDGEDPSAYNSSEEYNEQNFKEGERKLVEALNKRIQEIIGGRKPPHSDGED
jgi:hypothetical protein